MIKRDFWLKKCKTYTFLLHNQNSRFIFASVFHGIRFKVRRLFVVMTDNFFVLNIIHTFNQITILVSFNKITNKSVTKQ